MWKLGLVLGIVVAIVYLAACLLLLLRQTRLMYFPSATIVATPAQFGLPHEEVWIPVRQTGERLYAWWLPAEKPERGVILHFHGNGGNVSSNLGTAARLHQLGFSVLMVDYRGYGFSKGSFPTETQLYDDANSAWSYLTQTRGIPAQRIILFGHSLGGAIAIYLASQHPNAAGLIVESSFTSMRRMVDQMGQYWMFPIDWLLTQRFPSIERVRSLQMPVLYIHGTNDTLIPASMSRQLFEASPEPKQLYLVAGADHNNMSEVGGAAYLQTVDQFMRQVEHQSKSGPLSRQNFH